MSVTLGLVVVVVAVAVGKGGWTAELARVLVTMDMTTEMAFVPLECH